jgi:hypothetical protein
VTIVVPQCLQEVGNRLNLSFMAFVRMDGAFV